MSAEPTLATLMAELSAAEQRAVTDADDAPILAWMESAAARTGGLEQLTARFAASAVPVIARSLAFLLARAASIEQTPAAVAPLVWSPIARLDTDDDWTRVNLLSAVQLLAARDALPRSTEPVPAGLGAFLIDVLQRGEEILDAAGPALASLDAHNFFERLDRDQFQQFRDALERLVPPENKFTRADLATLRDRLSGSA